MKERFAGLVLAAMWAVVLWIAWTPEAAGGHGMPHARFSQMDQGGPGLQRHEAVFAAAWLLGSLMIALFVGLLAWQARSRRGPLPWFALGGLLFEAVFAMMCWAYWRSLAEPLTVSYWGSFPVPVAWLVYGIWLFPAFFITLYVVWFDEWIYPTESARRFEEILEARRQP